VLGSSAGWESRRASTVIYISRNVDKTLTPAAYRSVAPFDNPNSKQNDNGRTKRPSPR